MHKHWLGIHYLRSVAAGMVVLHHIPLAMANKGIVPPYSFEVGASGVDVFFVVSGFVMSGAIKGRSGVSGAVHFLVRRLIRILPAYWSLTLLLGLTAIFIPQLFSGFGADIEYIIKSLLFVPYFDLKGDMRPIISQGWTLNFEMFFYLVVSAVALSRTRLVMLYSVISLFVIVIGSTAVNIDRANSAAVLFSPIIIEFAFGYFIYVFVNSNCKLGSHHGFVIGLGGVILSFLLLFFTPLGAVDSVGFSRVLFWGVPAAILVLGVCVIEKNAIFPKLKLLVIAGDSSYSLYLVHGLVFTVLIKVFGAVYLSGYIGVSILFLAACLGGLAMHEFYEKPLGIRFGKIYGRFVYSAKVKPNEIIS